MPLLNIMEPHCEAGRISVKASNLKEKLSCGSEMEHRPVSVTLVQVAGPSVMF